MTYVNNNSTRYRCPLQPERIIAAGIFCIVYRKEDVRGNVRNWDYFIITPHPPTTGGRVCVFRVLFFM